MCNRYECTEAKVSMMIVIKLFEKGGYFRRSTLSLNLIPCCQVVKYGMLWQAQAESEKVKTFRTARFCRKNFPDKARKSRQFSNSRQMPVKGVLARS